MQKEFELSKKTRGILYTFKESLKVLGLSLKQLFQMSFGSSKIKLKKSQFAELIRSLDDRLSFDQIDKTFQELNPNNEIHIHLDSLDYILKTITEEDDPFNNQLDIRSSVIIQQKKTKQLTEEQQAVLLLKQIKDKMKGMDPYQLLDLCDEDRDGLISIQQLCILMFNLGVNHQKNKKIVKNYVFGDNEKVETKDIINLLGLNNVGKRASLEQLKNVNNDIRQSCKLVVPQKNNVRSKIFDKNYKKAQVKLRQSMNNFVNIQKVLGPYYNSQSQMTQQLQNLAIKYIQSKNPFIDNANPKSSKNIKWEHSTKLFKKQYKLFEVVQSILERQKSRVGLAQLFQAKDIIQGSLGDCYLLSAVAGIAQHHPQIIYRLFVLDKNPGHIYGVRLFIDGQWQTVITDARFPVTSNNDYVYARPHGNQIWVQLLQKCYAKIYGSYQNIQSGLSEEGLRVISGAPTKNFTTTDKDAFKNINFYINQKKYILSTSGSKEMEKLGKQKLQSMGLVPNHAYSIIKLFQNVGPKKVTLIKLRNPWGNKQWKCDWSFYSTDWTPQLRKQFNYVKNPNDGTFYMNYEHFKYYFYYLSVCFIKIDNQHSNIKLKSNRKHSVMTKMIVKVKGIYTISIYQQSKRKYLNSSSYSLSKSRLFIGKKLENGKIKALKSKTEIQSNTHIQLNLEPGEYLISSKIIWKFEQEHQFNLTSYGPQKVKFIQIPPIKAFIQNFIIDKAQNQNYSGNDSYKKDQYKYPQIANSYRAVYANIDDGFGFLMIHNQSKRLFTSSIKFNKSVGLKMVKPYTFEDFQNMKIGAGQKVIKCFTIDPSEMRYSFSQSLKF